jgi:hypothetical protein
MHNFGLRPHNITRGRLRRTLERSKQKNHHPQKIQPQNQSQQVQQIQKKTSGAFFLQAEETDVQDFTAPF